MNGGLGKNASFMYFVKQETGNDIRFREMGIARKRKQKKIKGANSQDKVEGGKRETRRGGRRRLWVSKGRW